MVIGDKVVQYSHIDIMTPILTKQEGFRQVMGENCSRFTEFSAQIAKKIENAVSDEPSP